MPLIIDANVATDTFKLTSPDFEPVLKALFSGKASMAYGGQLLDEYEKITEVVRAVRALDQAGKAKLYSHKLLDAEVKLVKGTNLCKSNDEHVIALARLSKARLLCSKDQLLHVDFTNTGLLAPKGKIYQNAGHKKLIAELGE